MVDDPSDEAAVIAELRASEEFLRRLLEAVPAGVIHVGVDGSVIDANEEACRILGVDARSPSWKDAGDLAANLIFEDGRPCPRAEYPVTKALVTGVPQSAVTLGVRRPDEGLSWAVFTAVPVRDPTTRVTSGAVVTFLDISERKRAEEALQEREGEVRRAHRMEALGRMAGGLAHDFNNLLMPILGHAELLLDQFSDRPEVRRDVEAIQTAAKRGGSLTRQLLAFSGRRAGPDVPVDLNSVVGEARKMLQHMVSDEVELRAELDEDLWQTHGDAGLIEQLVFNLVEHACASVHEGGGAITVRTSNATLEESDLAERKFHLTPKAGKYVCLRVTYDGESDDEGTLDRVFDPFYSNESVSESAGLDLAAVHSICEGAGGGLEVKNLEFGGRKFSVYLPRSKGVPEAVEVTRTGPLDRPRTILLVEDERSVRTVLRRFLERDGYVVIECETGREALVELENHDGPIDMIVTDVVMPELNGIELAQAARSIRPKTKVLFISGYPELPHDAHRQIREDIMITKPFSTKILLDKVASLLELD